MDLYQIFKTNNPVIGVVHLLPLPTSPRWGGSLKAVIARAEQEATALAAGGVDGIIVENFFDAPFAKDRVDPAVVSAMTLIVDRLRSMVMLPLGINVLRNDAKSAMAIASCLEAQFIRVNVLTGIMATDQGLIEGKAHELLRYRRELGTEVGILADVLVKHARPLGAPNLTGERQSPQAAEGLSSEVSSEVYTPRSFYGGVTVTTAVQDTIARGLADAVILSGWATGSPPTIEDLELAATAACDTPVFIGSGANWENISRLMSAADGVIVASSLKRKGKIEETIDPIRVSQFVEAARQTVKKKDKYKSVSSIKLTK